MEMNKNTIDMRNCRVGKLTIIDAAFVKNESVYWNCICDCGTKKIISGSSLRRKDRKTQSCGCLQKEKQAAKKGIVGKRKYSYEEYQYKAIEHAISIHAMTRGIEFSLTKAELLALVFLNCYYCNAEPANKIIASRNGDNDIIYSGLDRIDSAKGYNINNVVPSCKICNIAKGIMSQEEFYAWVLKIAKNITATSKIVNNSKIGIDFSRIWS